MGEFAYAVYLWPRCAWTLSRGGSSVAAAVLKPVPAPSSRYLPWTRITSIVDVSGCNFDNTLPFSTLYPDFWSALDRPELFKLILELLPIFFRDLADWLVIGLTIVAAFVLGWQRAWLPFPTLLLLMGTFLAFRARRDVWVLVLAALFIISEFGRFVRS